MSTSPDNSSDDDEAVPHPTTVSHYYFENDNQEPTSFATLPLSLSAPPTAPPLPTTTYVRGTADGGLHKLYKPVKAWRFDISGAKPEVSVLSRDGQWIRLLKPRPSYEEYIGTVLVAVKFLHLVKRRPGFGGKAVWDELARDFRLMEERPSPKHVLKHRELIESAMEHDESLSRSKHLMSLLEKNSEKKNRADENVSVKGKSEFIVDDDDCANDDLVEEGSDDEEGSSGDEKDSPGNEEDDSGDEEDAFDAVCCICDNGGTLLCCEGSCMRSFHATPRAARKADSHCVSLGLTEKEVEDIQIFKCQNCQYKRHQCYSCGKLGSSDKESGAEVFQCVNATCGHFYHPHCVANHLHGGKEDAARELREKIVLGESFTCPLHVCGVCRLPEDKSNYEMRMAVCRRCPTAYHKQCLPWNIAFEDDDEKNLVQRAWDDDLLPGRFLMYCLKHDIVEDLGTPLRDHIKFPRGETEFYTPQQMEDKVVQKTKKPVVGAPSRVRPAPESKIKRLEGNQPDKTDRRISKLKGINTSRKLPAGKKSLVTELEHKSPVQPDLVKPSKIDKLDDDGLTKTTKTVVKAFQLDSDSEERILKIMKEASSMITMDEIIAKHEEVISSHAYKQRMDPCKSITQGKVEASRKAVQEATVKLDGGGSIEDAKAICEPQILNQMVKWKSKLRVYLAPFLYGMRYTSFGRHFTKTDKLQEIVDKIHWYVNSKDMIVDFCCGANDFSLLMKQTLEKTGKTYYYKNYDRFRPKNDFSFEKRDWMSVQPKELPNGSQLIMGLNPPFGVKAGLANQFINKALEFKPKLLILIVPQETQRLDEKQTPYDLVWEDRELLSGKSFYLPGSVDIKDKQMEDWNVVPPILYLWSRPDWTARHKAIAKKHGHLHGGGEGNHTNRPDSDPLLTNAEDTVVSKVDGVSPLADEAEELKMRAIGGNDDFKNRSSSNDHARERRIKAAIEGSRAKRGAKKKRRTEEMHVREAGESSREYKRRRSSPMNPHHGLPRRSPVNLRDGRASSPSRYQRSPANAESRDPGHDQYEHINNGERRSSLESQPFMYQNPPPNVEIRDPAQDLYEPTGYGGTFRGREFGIPGSYYEGRNHNPVTHMHPGGRERWPVDPGPHANYDPRISPPLSDYPSHISGEWASGHMRAPEGYGVNQPYSGPEHRYSTSTYPTESAYSSHATMSAINKYHIGLDELNPSRMSGYNPDPGHHHLAPRQGYPGVPMGFATGPFQPFPRHDSSTGGWVDD